MPKFGVVVVILSIDIGSFGSSKLAIGRTEEDGIERFSG